MKRIEPILESSPFSNTYGGLSLVLGEDLEHYLEMEDCLGPDYYGPLTDEHVAAFMLLCELPRVED